MEPESTRIDARSRRQAMDWSLVLASQGIESTIEQPGDGSGWSLLVSSRDFQPALSAIDLYTRENRAWIWRRRLVGPGLVFDWGSLAWVLLIAVFYWLDSVADFRTRGIVDSTALWRGEWWRVFTGTWLHADIGHLATNAIFGVLLLGLAMGRYGAGVGLLASYLAGATANLITCLVDRQEHHSLGASGVVMAALGLLAAQAFWLWKFGRPALRVLLSAVAAGLMLFILLGLAPGTDVVAHAGGFAMGLGFGAVLAPAQDLARRSILNSWCGFVFLVLVIVPWALAMGHRL